MSQNIQKQLENVVFGCASPCHSKRADKFNDDIDTSWKIYANTSFDDMRDLARNFGKFIREHYPDKTRTYQIDRDIVQAYFNSKPDNWANETMWTNYSRIKKLEICCKHVFFRDKDKFNWDMKNIFVPKSTKKITHKKDKSIPMEVSRQILSDMRDNRSETVNAATLSVYLGMRARETTCLKVENVHFTAGEFKLGWIQIIRGPEGGAKGGRPRRIPIMDQEAQDALKSIVAGKRQDDYVVTSAKGGKMLPDTIEKAICKALKRRFGDTYLYNDAHGMRKTFAQRYYDITREKYEKKQAVGKTNAILGHGYNRGPSGLKKYVANMW